MHTSNFLIHMTCINNRSYTTLTKQQTRNVHLITGADAKCISMHCQQFDTLKIHMIQYTTIEMHYDPCFESTQCNLT